MKCKDSNFWIGLGIGLFASDTSTYILLILLVFSLYFICIFFIA